MITIRARAAEDNAQLADIWLRSVRATHHFLTEDNIAQLFPLVLNDYLPAVNVWVAEERPGHPCGFIGLNGNKVEMLFIDADQRGKGVGKALLTHAETLHDELQLDVNEQNPQASGFYRHYGFVITGRSPLDGQGNPFPLLHMKLETLALRRPPAAGFFPRLPRCLIYQIRISNRFYILPVTINPR